MKNDRAQIEAYIERTAREMQRKIGNQDAGFWAFKYGALFAVLDDCLAVMSEQQKEVAIGHMLPRAERCAK